MKRNPLCLLLLAMALLLLWGCSSGNSDTQAETVLTEYEILPSAQKVKWEGVIRSAISSVAEHTEQTGEPLDFQASYHPKSKNWVVTLIYEGAVIYNINVDSTNAQVHTIVKMPSEYFDALSDLYNATSRYSQEAEVVYSQEQSPLS